MKNSKRMKERMDEWKPGYLGGAAGVKQPLQQRTLLPDLDHLVARGRAPRPRRHRCRLRAQNLRQWRVAREQLRQLRHQLQAAWRGSIFHFDATYTCY